MEIKIVTFVVKGSVKLTSLPIDRSKSKFEAEVLLSVVSLISSSNGANIQSGDAFIGEFELQILAVPCFCRFTNPVSFE